MSRRRGHGSCTCLYIRVVDSIDYDSVYDDVSTEETIDSCVRQSGT